MTELVMPKIDRKLISKKKEIVENLKKIIKAENILFHEVHFLINQEYLLNYQKQT